MVLRGFLLLLLALCFGPAAHGDPQAIGLSGKLLVAAPSMPDGRFKNTVIFICRHSRAGALGLVLNKELGTVPATVVAEQYSVDDVETDTAFRLVWGGPVDWRRSFILHSRDYVAESSLVVDEEVALTSDGRIVEDILSGQGPSQFVFALGYAGWGPGQLEWELERDDWITVPADSDFVFGGDLAEMWEAARQLQSLDL